MFRQIVRRSTDYRCFSLIFYRQNKEDINTVKKKNDCDVDTLPKNNNHMKKEIPDLNYKPVTAKPFEEFHPPKDTKTVSSDIAEFIDNLGPPLPISFNFAAYVNQSENLQKLVQLGVDLSKLEKDPKKANYVLKLDFERDIKAHIQFLHDNGVNPDFLGKIITKNPFLFKESVETLEIRLNYLRSKKFSKGAISRIIENNPIFLSLTTKTVDTRLGFFQKQFSLSGNQVRYLITKAPKLITYRFENLTEMLFTMKEELGFNSSEMKTLLLMKPKVYTLERFEIRNRFHVVHNIMGLSHARILEFPGVLLTRNFLLKQRHQYLVHLGLAQYDPSQPMYISLENFAATTDSGFCEKCAKTSVEQYNEFLRTL